MRPFWQNQMECFRNKRVRRHLLPFLILVLSLTVPPPSNFGQNKPTVGSDTPIKIGVFLDLSGRTSQFGRSTLQGIMLAADKINEVGGIHGRRLDILAKDDEGRPEYAADVAKKLIEQDRVVALLGEVASGLSLAAAPKAQAGRVPMISPSSTHPHVTAVGDYVFRVCFVDPFQGEAMADFAVLTLKARKAAILTDFNSPYSKSLAESFASRLESLGGQIVTNQVYVQGDRDYMAQLVSIRAKRPDVIYVPGYYGEIGLIAKQLKQLRLRQPLLGGDGWESDQLWQLGGLSLNGSYITSHYAADDPSTVVRQFVVDYKARYATLPDSLAALGYDAMGVLAEALRRSGTTDGPALRDAVAQTRDFKGVTGIITLDSDRNATKPAVILRLQNGKFVYNGTVQPRKR